MRHVLLPHRAARRSAARRAPAPHKSPAWSRAHRERGAWRGSDIVLALLGLTLLGALCLGAAFTLLGRVLTA